MLPGYHSTQADVITNSFELYPNSNIYPNARAGWFQPIYKYILTFVIHVVWMARLVLLSTIS